MKRIVIVLLIIIIVTFIGFGIYFAVNQDEEPPIISGDSSGEIIEPTASEKTEITTVLTKTNTQRRDVNVQMPAFMNLNNYSFQETINKEIADSINPYINEIAIVADESLPSTSRYKYTVEYERYNNDDYVSIVLSQNYSTGGLRSNAWKDTYTVDVVRNKKLTLEDICSSDDYKEKIVNEINKQAGSKKLNLVAGNGLSDIPDTQRYFRMEGKLYIYFEPASIAPYLDGEMIFEMPYKFADGKFIVE